MYEPFDYGIPVTDLRNRYSKLYSGLIYDVLDEMKIPNQALANDIKPLDDKWVLAGPAYTVKMESRPDVDTKLREYRLTMLDHMHPGMVEIRDCSHDEQAAHFGELNANIIRAKGCVGAVVDGGSRDSRFIKEMDFPVFCRYRNPVEALGRCVVTRVLVDIVMRGALTTGVTVRPWDYIFADMDGVIVIPREITKNVLEQCEHEFAKESESRTLYRDPTLSPLDIYKKLGKL
ncbi:MAG: RraA family protein [Spirochaetota bacterium]